MRMEFKIGDEVALTILRMTPMGFVVSIEETEEGLLHNNEIFQPIEQGMEIQGYIKNIREDGKIDVSLRPQGFRNVIEKDCDFILSKIKERGVLFLTDKSPADLVISQLQMSKKSFKKAVGVLYKQKKIILKPDSIVLVKNQTPS